MPREIDPNFWKGMNFYVDELKKAGVYNELLGFTDLLTGNERPGGYGEPVITDVMLGGKKCDVYHTDMDGKKRIGHGEKGNRVYIHFKE